MEISSPHLQALLRGTSRLMALLRAVAVAGKLAAAGVFAAVVAVFLDAAAKLPPAGLVTVDAAAVLFGAVAILWLALSLILHRDQPRRQARLIEAQKNIGDNRLINAVDLSDPRAGAVAESPALRGMAVAEGDALAATLSPGDIVDRRPAARAMGVLAATLLIAAVVVWMMPAVFMAAIPRYIHPWGDLPPYTPLRFAVTTEPEPIHQNEPAVIRARLDLPDHLASNPSGKKDPGSAELPDRADAVFIHGSTRLRVPMAQGDDGVFTLRVERAVATGDFYIDTPGGRSPRYRMTVEPATGGESGRTEARADAPHQQITEKNGSGGAGQTRQASQSQAQAATGQAGGTPHTQSAASGFSADIPESLNPADAANSAGAAAFLAGVPARFRDDAAAYFRRLAEESAGGR